MRRRTFDPNGWLAGVDGLGTRHSSLFLTNGPRRTHHGQSFGWTKYWRKVHCKAWAARIDGCDATSKCLAIRFIDTGSNIGLAPLQDRKLLRPFARDRILPELACNLDGINTDRFPPGLLIGRVMSGAVVGAAERHRKFIACLAAKRARLRVPQMVRI